ncbi:hypothetical protein [Nocardioides currus]|uniref:SnoaL-like domain-containing protein n=1 Tax=Nocardioides currus TaxID=2133958 RepID=A0A2R7YVF8_9ACTN|nr:hypothetical protein [Nocardioides currus]PUA80294.1 hypothetical protein C7S10_14250 [Nocardioides currus]
MRSALPGRPLRARRTAATWLLSLALLPSSVAVAGCSASTDPASPGAAASHVGATVRTEPAAPSELATTAQVGTVVGRLPGQRRKAVRKDVTSVIDRWWEKAYLSGAGSQTDVASAFPGFTPGARRRATFDRELMTNVDLDAAELTPLMRKVRLDLLAVDRRAKSVTARFDLRMRTTGTEAGRLRVSGRLFLTRKPQGWQVFGYDVSKGWL